MASHGFHLLSSEQNTHIMTTTIRETRADEFVRRKITQRKSVIEDTGIPFFPL